MIRTAITALVIGAAVAGCASTPRSEVDSINQRTTVTVENRGFSDMTIYASRGQRVRLGIAGGNAKTTFTIPSSLMAGTVTLHFIADPIGSQRQSVSQEITVSPGDEVGLVIPPG
jgi:hypothetical protein